MKITFPNAAPFSALAYVVRVQLKTTLGIGDRAGRPDAPALGTALRVVGSSKLEIPAGARHATISDASGRTLETRIIASGEREFQVPDRAEGALFVRFDP
jgi:hypothetical protein